MTTVLGIPYISQTLYEDISRISDRYPCWTPEAYLALTGNYLIEYTHRRLEILPMPTMRHQEIASRMYDAIRSAKPSGGLVLFAGTRVKIGPETFREPDVLYIPPEWKSERHPDYAERVALVVEIVSASNRDHDLLTKRAEYADARIPEYWIVDPDERQIIVLVLEGERYVPLGTFVDGQNAISKILGPLSVDVSELLAD